MLTSRAKNGVRYESKSEERLKAVIKIKTGKPKPIKAAADCVSSDANFVEADFSGI